MKTLPLPIFNGNSSKRVGGSACPIGALCLTFFSLILFAARMSATINHASIVAWLPEQRVVQGSPFLTK